MSGDRDGKMGWGREGVVQGAWEKGAAVGQGLEMEPVSSAGSDSPLTPGLKVVVF